MFGYTLIKKEDKARLDRLKIFEDVKLNMNILKEAGPEFLREVIKNIQALQNDLLKKSVKLRDFQALAYSDGASDFADKFKYELKQVLNKLVADPNVFNPVTGQKYKTGKNK